MDMRKRTIAILVLILAAILYLLVSNKEDPASEIPVDQLKRSQTSKPIQNQTNKYLKSTKFVKADVDLSTSLSDLKSKFSQLCPKGIIQLFSSDLSSMERNYLEHLLAKSQQEEVDGLLDGMLEDAFVDLSTKEEELNAIEDAVFLAASTNRMNSIIRAIGLRGNTDAVGNIIDIASHHNAEESTIRICYEAIGYLGTEKGKRFLLSELRKRKNPIIKSEIVLSLTKAGGAASVKRYLSYLKSRNPDLRNSAIVALGESKDEKAVDAFSKLFFTTSYSSQVLIVQALKKIGSDSSQNLLKRISQSYPQFFSGEPNQ